MDELTDDQLTEDEIRRLEIALQAAADSEDDEVCIGTNKMRKLLASASRERATRGRTEKVEEALRFYTSPYSWDTGRRARAALQQAKATGGAGEGAST